jgi:hypothetical protein
VKAASRSWTLFVLLILLVSTLTAGVALVASQSGTATALNGSGGSHFTTDTIGVSGTFTDATCIDVTTCSIAITPAEFSVMVLTLSIYGTTDTAPSAIVTNSAISTPYTIQANSATTSTPQIRIYTSVWSTSISKAVTSYVNYTTAGYYVLTIADFTNIDVSPSTLLVAGTGGTGNAGSNTTPRCAAITPGITGTVIIMGASVLSSSTFAAGGQFTKTASGSTTTDVVTGASEYLVDSGSGALTPAGTWGTTGSWEASCIALRPAVVPNAPTNLYAWGIQTSVLTIGYTITPSQAPYVTFVAIIYAPWNIYSDTCGSYAGVPSDSAWNTTQETVGGLTPGTAYCFEAYVDNTTGGSANSATLTDVVTVGNYAPPSNLQGAVASASPQTKVSLVWTYPSNSYLPVNYSVSYGTVYGTWATANTSVGSAAQDFTVTGLVANTTYYFEVWAWFGATTASFQPSNIAIVHTQQKESPIVTAPILAGTAVALTSATFAWTGATNTTAASYTLKMGTVYGTYTSSVNEGTATSATASGLTQNTTYYAEIEENSGTTPIYSNVVVIHTLSTPPPVVLAPVLTVVATGLTTMVASWSAGANFTAVNYTVLWGTSYGTYTGSNSMGGVGTLDYTITGLTQNTTYFVDVATWTAATARGPASNIAPAHTASSAAPVVTAPVLTVAATGLTTVVASWTTGTNFTAVNYTVLWGTTYGVYSGSHSLGGASTLDYTITGLSQNTTYFVEVETWTGATIRGPVSNIAPAHTSSSAAPVVTAPVLTVVATGLTTVVASWTAGTNFTSVNYTVLWGTTYGVYSGSHSLGGVSTLDYTIAGLSQNTTYFVDVATWTAATTRGPASNIAPAHTSSSAAPVVTAPVLTVVATGLTMVVASWTAGSNFTSVNYTVLWGTTYGSYTGSHSIGGASTFDYTITGLSQNTTYFVDVATWTGATTRGPASNIAPAHTSSSAAPVVTAPVLTVSATGLTSIVASWTTGTNFTAVNYTVLWGTTYGSYTGSHSMGGVGTLDYTITGLAQNTTYFVEVETWTGATTRGPVSNIAPAHTGSSVPPIVFPPVLTASAGDNQPYNSADLSWTAPQNVTVVNYTVLWGFNYGFYVGSYSFGSAPPLNYVVTGLQQNETYYFLIETWTSVSTRGPSSNIAPAHTAATQTPIVVDSVLSVVATGLTTAELTWTATQNVTLNNYTVEWGTTYGIYTHAFSYGTTAPFNYEVTGLSANMTYYFVIETWTTNMVRGPYSNAAPAQTQAVGPPVVVLPALSVVATGLSSVVLTWTAGANFTAVNYTVEWGTTYGSYSGSHSMGGVSTLTYTVTGLALNTTYYFLLETWTTATIRGPVSNIAPAHTLAVAPPVITAGVLSVVATGLTTVTLAWTAPTNVTVSGYTVKWGTVYGTYGSSASVGDVLDYTVTGLGENTTYFFEVVPNIGPITNVAPAHTQPYVPVIVASVLAVSATGIESVSLTWSAPINETVTGYTVKWGTVYGTYGSSASVGDVLDYTVTGLAPNTTYFFIVDPNVGPDSNVAPAHTAPLTGLGAPVVVQPILSVVSVGQTVVALAWTSPQNESVDSYAVYVDSPYGSYVGSFDYSASTNHATITGLDDNTTYYFNVTVEGSSGPVGASNWAPAQTLAYAPIVPPKVPVVLPPVLTATPVSFTDGDYAYVNWTAPTNFTVVNYTLLQGPIDSWPVWTSATSEGLVFNAEAYQLPCSTYEYQVEAWNSTGAVVLSNPTPLTSGGCAAPNPNNGADEVLYTLLAVGVIVLVVGGVILIRRRYTEGDE